MRRPKALLGAHRLDQPVDEQSHGHARSYFLLCAALFALRFQAWCCESLLDLKQTTPHLLCQLATGHLAKSRIAIPDPIQHGARNRRRRFGYMLSDRSDTGWPISACHAFAPQHLLRLQPDVYRWYRWPPAARCAKWQRVLDQNLFPAVRLDLALLPKMIEQGSASSSTLPRSSGSCRWRIRNLAYARPRPRSPATAKVSPRRSVRRCPWRIRKSSQKRTGPCDLVSHGADHRPCKPRLRKCSLRTAIPHDMWICDFYRQSSSSLT